MKRKVEVAVFDRDLKVERGKYPLTDDGSKIKIKKGGKGHWYPEFDNQSYLEFPSLFGTKRVYIVRKNAAKCVSFADPEGTVYGPDPELVEKAAEDAIRRSMKQDKQETPFWVYLVILLLLGVAGRVFGVI